MQTSLNFNNRCQKWLYIFKYYFKRTNGSAWSIAIFQLGGIVNIFGLTLIWVISKEKQDLTSLKGVLSYILIGKVYFDLINTMIHISIGSDINNGSLSNALLRPTNYFGIQYVSNIGSRASSIVSTILASIIPFLICNYFITPLDFNFNFSLLIILIFLPFSFLIRQYIAYLIGFISFFNRDKRNVDGTVFTILMLLNYFVGIFIPLYKITERFPAFDFLNYLPTSFLLHHPMQIYLGKYNQGQILMTFGGMILWSILMWLIARIIFQKGLKLYESTGL